MPFIPLSQVNITDCFKNIRLIATDMDGTLTVAGKFTPDFIKALQTLVEAGIHVLIVTGRSAGWVSGLAHYLPIWGAIAENGGLFYTSHSASQTLLVPIPDLVFHRQQLASVFKQVQTKFPQLQESSDNRFRLTDWTFDVAGLSVDAIEEIEYCCLSLGWGFTYSNVQCHIKLLQQNKAAGLLQVLSQYFPALSPEQVLTVGDSPNDESLFDDSKFPFSVGVANVKEYSNQLKHYPTYITTAQEGEGFVELTQHLLNIH